ncbi:MAG: amidohydrolase family protein [Planctomycetota bacterium]|jgi:cytosine/adenosine deaminase-related metal-dependent hydrolase|nr:amidohydrolase family protein [Planctomycetota bacterium]MDP6839315.1 amidohydrolase family protein [Planctomycetota bacterium]
MGAQVLTAPLILTAPGQWVEGGGVFVCGGRIEAVLASAKDAQAVAGEHAAELLEFPDTVLTPGLVNAHTHLELSPLAGRLGQGLAFRAWVDELLAARGKGSPEEQARALEQAAQRMLETGTTLVGDIAAGNSAEEALAESGPARVCYREVLDGGEERRAAAALTTVAAPLAQTPDRYEGLSPHAPYSTSSRLLAGARDLARERNLPLAIHWAETEEEERWMMRGRGPLKGLVKSSPRCSPLDHLDAAGLLGPRLALIHGNHPRSGDHERLAAAGTSLVHCPGSHRWFDRRPFDIDAYLAAGVNLALGTDSLASNADLSLVREMAILREEQPHLAPECVWNLATVGGARALCLAGQAGVLEPGARADICAWPRAGLAPEAWLDSVTRGQRLPRALWLGGRRRHSALDTPA